MSVTPHDVSGFAPLVVGTRGAARTVETQHIGAISVVDGTGKELAALGDTSIAFPLRSTAKPFQLLPLVLDGLHDAASGPGFSRANLAVMMASHSGETMHTERVAAILQASGLTSAALQCGAHPPYDAATTTRMLAEGSPPSPLHCNCSGKHAAMLSVCVARAWPLDTYLEPTHPLQKRIEAIIARLSEADGDTLAHSIDGCSAPTYWVPLRGLARMFAALANPGAAPEVEAQPIAAQLAGLYEAGVTFPELVGGTTSLDSGLMRAMEGRVFAKTGAAGMYGVAVRPNARFPDGLGIALKVLDGDAAARVRRMVAVEVLRQFGLGDGPELTPDLERLSLAEMQNFRGTRVGRYEPVFDLAGGQGQPSV